MRRTLKSDQRGFSAMEVIIGAIVLSVLISVFGFVANWMQESLSARRANNPLLNKQHKNSVKDVKPGQEFGSVVITFNL